MPELIESLPLTEKIWLLLILFGILIAYVFGLIRHYKRKNQMKEEKSRVLREELSLGAESLFFHVPFNIEEKEITNAQ